MSTPTQSQDKPYYQICSALPTPNRSVTPLPEMTNKPSRYSVAMCLSLTFGVIPTPPKVNNTTQVQGRSKIALLGERVLLGPHPLT